MPPQTFLICCNGTSQFLNLGVGLTNAGTELTNAGLTQRHNVEGALAAPVDPNAFVTAPAPLSAAVVSMVVMVSPVEVPVPMEDALAAEAAADAFATLPQDQRFGRLYVLRR